MFADRERGSRRTFISVLGLKSRLCWPDVLGTRAFLPHAFGVRHLLAFTQVFETDTLDRRRMEEQVFVSRRFDEPESLVHHLFDRAFGHFCISLNDLLGWDADRQTLPTGCHRLIEGIVPRPLLLL